MARRFRGYLPVAIDVETGGFHAATDALLEIAAVLIDMDADGQPRARRHAHLSRQALRGLRAWIRRRSRSPASTRITRCGRRCRSATRCSACSAKSATCVRAYGCRRAILVGHNAAFDLGFLNAAVARADSQAQPVPSRSRASTPRRWPARRSGRRCWPRRCVSPGIEWDPGSAHSAPLRCRAQRRPVLPGVQSPARQPCRRPTSARARWAGSPKRRSR